MSGTSQQGTLCIRTPKTTTITLCTLFMIHLGSFKYKIALVMSQKFKLLWPSKLEVIFEMHLTITLHI